SGFGAGGGLGLGAESAHHPEHAGHHERGEQPPGGCIEPGSERSRKRSVSGERSRGEEAGIEETGVRDEGCCFLSSTRVLAGSTGAAPLATGRGGVSRRKCAGRSSCGCR